MQFQVVVQFSAAGIETFDAFVEIEEALMQALEPEHVVDGHDFGSDEGNIFIHTNDPASVLKAIRLSLGPHRMNNAKVAFRPMGTEEYRWLHPSDAKSEFHVL